MTVEPSQKSPPTDTGIQTLQVSPLDLIDSTVPSTDIAVHIMELLECYPREVQMSVISYLFQQHSRRHYSIAIPPDFLQLAVNASVHLKNRQRSNVVYGLARAVGLMRDDGLDSRLPASRMPMGLLEHIVNNQT